MNEQQTVAPPSPELADIFRKYGQQYIEKHGISRDQKCVMKAIEICRTPVLGGHVLECDACGHQELSYNSCRDRHCPKCQAAERAKWLEKRNGELLNVEYYHIVFALSSVFNLIALQNKKVVYNLFFRAASETLLQLAKDPKHLGVKIGFFGLMHTWGQLITHHPHIHFVVPGGGLSEDNKWISTPKGFFLPIKVIQRVFRGKFIDLIKRAYYKGQLTFHGDAEELKHPEVFEALLDKACRHQWYVHFKLPFGGPGKVLKYLARYTHRIAISNKRIVSMENGMVSFKWKDYRDHDRIKIKTLDVFKFIRRFLLHVLPPGFVRIRYYGFLASRNRTSQLELCKTLMPVTEESFPDNGDGTIETFFGRDEKLRKCPVCKEGSMVKIMEFGRISLNKAIWLSEKYKDTA